MPMIEEAEKNRGETLRMTASFVRINIGGEKKDALIAARRVRNRLEMSGAKQVRGEFVRSDGRVYVDVDESSMLPKEDIEGEAYGAASLTFETLTSLGNVDECPNCGNVSDEPLTCCPNCGFREISPCPQCDQEIPRVQYLAAGGSLFQCPKCRAKVRLRYNEPIWREDGSYSQPVVIVTHATRRRP